ncbi:MAG: hypothetical protein HY392_01860 [Candidatus Diapherotrites archaeon]|nr:hypothetical protein [Candidatus Diapherotrites archaeon]
MKALAITYDDLLAEAMSALVLAARAFKPSRGFAFSTYAWRSMRWQFVTLIKKRNKELHINKRNILSLDMPVKGTDPSEPSLYALIPHRAGVSTTRLKTTLVDAVDSLKVPERDKRVFFANTGLLSGSPMTLAETGAMFGGLSRERVRQIGNKIMGLLKRNRGLLSLWEYE